MHGQQNIKERKAICVLTQNNSCLIVINSELPFLDDNDDISNYDVGTWV